MNIKTINMIEVDYDKWYLTIGKKAPWDNPRIRLPKFIAIRMNKFINKIKGEK